MFSKWRIIIWTFKQSNWIHFALTTRRSISFLFSVFKIYVFRLCTVAHTYTTRFLGGRDWEDFSLRLVLAKSSQSTHLNQWLDVVVSCLSSQLWGEAQIGESGPGWLGHKVRPCLQNNPCKKDWGCGLGGSYCKVLSLIPSTASSQFTYLNTYTVSLL
jgi:hypothetical protein